MRAIRGVLSGYLALVALQVLVSPGGSSKTKGLLGALSSIIDRALSPRVAAIPDYAGAAGGASGSSTAGATRKSGNAGAAAAAGVDRSVAILGGGPSHTPSTSSGGPPPRRI